MKVRFIAGKSKGFRLWINKHFTHYCKDSYKYITLISALGYGIAIIITIQGREENERK